MSKHIRRACLRSIALKAEDTALISMLTENKKSLVNAKCYYGVIYCSKRIRAIATHLFTVATHLELNCTAFESSFAAHLKVHLRRI